MPEAKQHAQPQKGKAQNQKQSKQQTDKEPQEPEGVLAREEREKLSEAQNVGEKEGEQQQQEEGQQLEREKAFIESIFNCRQVKDTDDGMRIQLHVLWKNKQDGRTFQEWDYESYVEKVDRLKLYSYWASKGGRRQCFEGRNFKLIDEIGEILAEETDLQGNVMYLVKWVGEMDPTWDTLDGFSEEVEEWKKRKGKYAWRKIT